MGEQLVVAAVQVAVRDIPQNAALERPEAPSTPVEDEGCMNIEDLILTLDLSQVALALAAHAHQVEADHDIEYFN